MSFNDPLSPIRLQLMWDRLISVVEEQALTLVRVGFSTSTREAGDLSAGVFDLNGAMLAQAVTGTPGPHQLDGARGAPLHRQVPGQHHGRGRHLRHQRSLEGHRPPARLHVRDADLLSRQGRRAVCQHLSRGRCRWARHDGRRGLRLRGRHLHSADALCARRRGRRNLGRPCPRQCARAGPGRGRSLFARHLQRDRLPPARRHDG